LLNGFDREIDEEIIGVYTIKEEAEKNKPDNKIQKVGGDDYTIFYNYINYEIRSYTSPKLN